MCEMRPVGFMRTDRPGEAASFLAHTSLGTGGIWACCRVWCELPGCLILPQPGGTQVDFSVNANANLGKSSPSSTRDVTNYHWVKIANIRATVVMEAKRRIPAKQPCLLVQRFLRLCSTTRLTSDVTPWGGGHVVVMWRQAHRLHAAVQGGGTSQLDQRDVVVYPDGFVVRSVFDNSLGWDGLFSSFVAVPVVLS